jgi:hypothetical protein
MALCKFKISIGFAVGILLACPGLVLGQEQRAIEVDVCTLAAHPKEFNNKLVRVNARVESAVIEGGTWLEDPSCREDGVELSVPDSIRSHPEEHPDFKALDDSIRLQGNIGTLGKSISATFIGRFTSRSKRPKRVLTLERIENLEVKVEKS